MSDNLKETLLWALATAVAIVFIIKTASCGVTKFHLDQELDKFKEAASIAKQAATCQCPHQAEVLIKE